MADERVNRESDGKSAIESLIGGHMTRCDQLSSTHSTVYDNKRTFYCLDKGKGQTFWISYAEIIRDYGNICLYEHASRNEEIPVIVEFIFGFDTKDMENDIGQYYDDDFVLSIIHIYQDIIKKNFNITTSNLKCCYFEAEDIWEDNGTDYWKVKFHFPLCRIGIREQNEIIRPKAISAIRQNNIFSLMSILPTGDISDTVKPLTENILMYGSNRSPESKYMLSYIIKNINRGKMSMSEWMYDIKNDPNCVKSYSLNIKNIYKYFPLDKHQDVVSGIIHKDTLEISDGDIWYPLMFSIHYCLEITQAKEIVTKRGKEEVNVPTNGSSLYDYCRFFLDCMKDCRFTDPIYNQDIGKALYNTDMKELSDEGKEIWESYLRKYLPMEKILEETKNYSSYSKSLVTWKTLAWYAREDNPDKYFLWYNKYCTEGIINSLDGSDVGIGNCFYRFYFLDFICSDYSRNHWYFYKNHKWIPNGKGVLVLRKMKNFFIKEYENVRTQFSQKISRMDENNERERKEYESYVKDITKVISLLKKVTVMTRILKTCSIDFEDPEFFNNIDQNPNVTGFTNGVMETYKDRIIFRNGKPEDYITKSTDIKYQELSWDNIYVKEVISWIDKIFCDYNTSETFKKFCASIFYGSNIDKIFPFLSGKSGDNSKSTLVRLLTSSLGSYTIKFPLSVFVSSTGRVGGVSPELARSDGVRLTFVEEPEGEEKMKSSTAKKTTGGDSFFCRFLQHNGKDIKPMFRPLGIVNNMPPFVFPDKAIKNRVYLLPCDSEWVDNPPDDPEEQWRQRKFKKDPFFDSKIPMYAAPFIWILVQYYPKYFNEGLNISKSINKATRRYWKRTDTIYKFIQSNIEDVYTTKKGERVIDNSVSLHIDKIYPIFKEWFEDKYPKEKILSEDDLEANLEIRWGPSKKNKWTGKQIKEDE